MRVERKPEKSGPRWRKALAAEISRQP